MTLKRFGAKEGPKPYEFIGFGAMEGVLGPGSPQTP